MLINNLLFILRCSIYTVCVLVLITFPVLSVCVDYIQNSITYTEIKWTKSTKTKNYSMYILITCKYII